MVHAGSGEPAPWADGVRQTSQPNEHLRQPLSVRPMTEPMATEPKCIVPGCDKPDLHAFVRVTRDGKSLAHLDATYGMCTACGSIEVALDHATGTRDMSSIGESSEYPTGYGCAVCG